MKKNLVSLLLVGALVAPSALVLAQEVEDLDMINVTTEEPESEVVIEDGISTLSDVTSEDNDISLFSENDETSPSIDELKEVAKLQIDEMNLTADRKADFKGAINEATSEEEVHSLLEKAKAEEGLKDAEDLIYFNEYKEEAKLQIDALVNISDAQKANYKGAINASITIEDIDSFVAQAVTEDLADVKEEYKENARAEIDATKLSDELKANYKGAINASTTKDEIDKLVAEAQAKSEENQVAELRAKKDEALDELDELDLTDEERANFKKQAEEAVTVEEVESVLQVARKVSTVNKATTLAEAKTAGLDVLNNLNLSTQDLELFTSGINEAETVDAVKEVLETATTVSEFNNNVIDGLVEEFPELKDKEYTYETVREDEDDEITITVKDTEDNVVAVYVYDVTTGEYTEVNSTPLTREDLLGRDDDLVTFNTEDEAQAAIDALDEEEQEGLEVKETDDGLFYVAHVISATPIEPVEPIEPVDNFHVNVVKNDFPQYDKEGYSYEVETLDDFVFITITDADGEFVAEIEYNIADQTTRIVSIALIPLEPAQPIEETTEEETTEEGSEEESTVEESEVVDVVTADGQPVQVVRTDSRSELPETGELGGATAMMAAALSALGGLGLLFKKRK